VNHILGALDIDPSADTPQSFNWGSITTTQDLFADGEPITITADAATKTVTGSLPDTTTVFTLSLNDDLSAYSYHQYMAIQSEVSGVAIAANLSGGNSSSFRLSSNGSVEDPIQTLFYGYEYDDDESSYVRSTVNTSANNMGVGTGQDVDSDAGQEDQLLISFDQNVTDMSLMVDITGNNTADLKYTIYSVKPAELANLGADGFTYNALPAGGISQTVTVEDDDTVSISAEALGLDSFTFIVFEAADGEYKLVPEELTVTYLSDAEDFGLSAGIQITDGDMDSASDTINIAISGTLDNLTGDGDANALGGNAEDNTLDGQAGNDLLSGGQGDDTLMGGLGSDTFVWHLNDGGNAGTPANDTITDFDTAQAASGGDVLNLSELLVGENGGDLTDYLHFELNGGGDTVLQINTQSNFSGGYDINQVEQSVVMENVDLVSAFTDINNVTDQASLIQSLISDGKLITDV